MKELLINLRDDQIQARFDGQGARSVNLDTPGIALLNLWKGTLQSNALSFDVL